MGWGLTDRRRQYAALPWRMGERGVEVLLVTSRQTRRWIIPKGWPMKGRTGPEAAAQEAWEEGGVRGRIAGTPLGTFGYVKRYADAPDRTCAVKVFALAVSEEDDVWPEMSQRERRWMTLSEAAAAVDEPELKALILGFAPSN